MSKELDIKIWDVKHGHGIYINTPTGKHIVIDLGVGSHSSGDTFSPLLHLKENYGIKKIDLLIVTHPHMDHIDDILNLDVLKPEVISFPKFTDTELAELLKNCQSKDKEKMEKFIEYRRNYNIPISHDRDIINNSNVSGVESIKRFRTSNEQSNINDVSCVTVIQYMGYKIVIPGDNEKSSWNEFLERKDFKEAIKDADVYLASHHGRDSGYHDDVMKILNPKLVIISDSKKHGTSSEKYTQKSQGLNIWSFDKDKQHKKEFRKTLSTHNDGRINIRVSEEKKALWVIKGYGR